MREGRWRGGNQREVLEGEMETEGARDQAWAHLLLCDQQWREETATGEVLGLDMTT